MAPNSRKTSVWVNIENGALDKVKLNNGVEYCSKKLSSSETSELLDGSKQFYDLIMTVWSLDTSHALDAAELVCARIRETGGLNSMLKLLTSSDDHVSGEVIKGLEQIMDAPNRSYIAAHKDFDTLVRVACGQTSLETVQYGTGILENLFKESEATCYRLIKLNALEAILLSCRSTDSTVLQHCAAALANCGMYGGSKCWHSMVESHADHWLFPLAFSQDNVVKYYALLAIVFLASSEELEDKVTRSGTLDLVLPFLLNQEPEEFPKMCYNHAHGRDARWLKNLLPLLVCGNEEARSLSAFHFAMEAAIKKQQQRLHVFVEIDAITHLQQSAKTGSKLTACLCCQALATCAAPLPPYKCWDALNWTTTHVEYWVADQGMFDIAPAFKKHMVTGNILLDLTLDDLVELGLSRLQGRWFLEQVMKLRCLVDVSNRDNEGLCKWLMGVSKDLGMYRVNFIKSGVTRSDLSHLTDEILTDMGISKSIHRLKILLAIRNLGSDSPDSFHLATPPSKMRRYDVFISYRRATGSPLASLLKVHLQVQGLSVFLDVEELGSGKFDEAILSTISMSSNMVLVLSPGALDRCIGDSKIQDWVHREILGALDSKVQIIPIMDPEFKWPRKEDLPRGLQQICTLNGILWSHEYQDASVEKLTSFLQLPTTFHRRSRGYSLHDALSAPA